jgi:hypothetical protein
MADGRQMYAPGRISADLLTDLLSKDYSAAWGQKGYPTSPGMLRCRQPQCGFVGVITHDVLGGLEQGGQSWKRGER